MADWWQKRMYRWTWNWSQGSEWLQVRMWLRWSRTIQRGVSLAGSFVDGVRSWRPDEIGIRRIVFCTMIQRCVEMWQKIQKKSRKMIRRPSRMKKNFHFGNFLSCAECWWTSARVGWLEPSAEICSKTLAALKTSASEKAMSSKFNWICLIWFLTLSDVSAKTTCWISQSWQVGETGSLFIPILRWCSEAVRFKQLIWAVKVTVE